MNRVDQLLQQAIAQRASGYPRAAIDLCLKAIDLDRQRWDLYCELADALQDTGDLDQADRCYAAAHKLAPNQLVPIIGAAAVAERRGDLEQAKRLTAPLVGLPNAPAPALAVWGEACRRLGESADVVPVLSHAVAQPRADAELAALHHTLAKALNTLGRHSEAFEQYSAANSCLGQRYDPREDSAVVERLTQVPSLGPLHAVSLDATPVLIVGFMRSGSTVLEQALGRHSEIATCGEHEVLVAISDQVPRQFGFTEAWPEATSRFSAEQTHQAAALYIREMLAVGGEAGATFVTDKTLVNVRLLELAARLFPKLKVIHCVRDPLDTCLSCFTTQFSASHGYTTQLGWLGHAFLLYQKMMAHHQAVSTADIYTVSYEQLVTSPENELKGVVEFLGLSWEEACLHPEENPRIANTASYAQVRDPFHGNAIGKSEDYLEMLQPLREILDKGL